MLQGLTKKAICAKQLKGLNNFFNTPKLSILYRNMNRKALKRLFFVDSVVCDYKPMDLYLDGLKSGNMH